MAQPEKNPNATPEKIRAWQLAWQANKMAQDELVKAKIANLPVDDIERRIKTTREQLLSFRQAYFPHVPI